LTDEASTLSTVMEKTAQLIEGVERDQWAGSTPCTDWDVQRLLAHLVGWSGNFAARWEGVQPEAEPDAIELGDRPSDTFRANAGRITAVLDSGQQPPEDAPGADILTAEEILHGWDLAVATGQLVPYTDDESVSALAAMKDMLKPEYRGYGFEAEVDVPDDAGTLDRLLAFSGRDPERAELSEESPSVG
jgi:uncharacterized protein (TIGR03086 family)